MKILTTKQIREANLNGEISQSYNGFDAAPNKINFSNGQTLEFVTSKERQLTWNKLIRMGFQLTEVDNNFFEKWMNT